MNKRLLVFGTLLAAVGGLAVLALYLLFLRPVEYRAPTMKELDERAARLGVVLPPSAPAPVHPAAPIDPKKPVRLAIGWLGLPDQAQNEQVADLMLGGLSPVKNLQLVDRQSLDKVLQESQMSLSGLVRAGTATRLGKLLRADWFLLGSAATVNGSNYLVIRLVDARTGVMLNADLFSRQAGVSPLVSKLSAFVRQSRESASHPGTAHSFLAVGGFQDVSLNDRQAGFPDKLRGYLTAAFQGSPNVTLLEREFVDLLQQELRLDLAGLTEEGATNATQPMQAAFWLVDGSYQSYESAGYEVEVVLRVHRMFGRTEAETLRGPPEEPLFLQIKNKIDISLTKTDAQLLAPTRSSEIQAQLAQGRQLTEGIVAIAGAYKRGAYWGIERKDNLARRNLEEAIRTYETVLVLDPENHEAKMGLASCLQHPYFEREAEARNYAREVAESSLDDRWRLRAMVALGNYYRFDDPAQAVEWYKRASDYSKTNPPMTGLYVMVNESKGLSLNGPADYLTMASIITDEMRARTNVVSPRKFDPESQLVEGTREMLNLFTPNGMFSDASAGYGIESFVRCFGTNRAIAVKQLNELLPGLLEKFPEIAPDLLAIALTYQLDTNSPVVAKFVESFEKCAEHPDQVRVRHNYFWRISRQCYNWCMENKMYGLALRLVEVKCRVQMTDNGIEAGFGVEMGIWGNSPVLTGPFTNGIVLEDKMRLVYAYMGLERWRDALDLLETVPGQPFFVGGGVLGGGGVVPSELVAQCREKLGLPVEKDSRLFTLGKPWWSFEDPGVFTTDQDSLWIAVCCKLWKVDLDLKTNMEINLPKTPNSRITVLCSEPSRLWVGTMGDGLIEYDKRSHKSKKYTDKDGLLINDISAICPQGEELWLGFGHPAGVGQGGLGRLDLGTSRARSFTPSLQSDPRNSNQAPRESVTGIVAGRPDELLISVGSGGSLRRYTVKENGWEALPWTASSLASDSRRLVLGLNETVTTINDLKGIGILVQYFADGRVDKLGPSNGLPNTQIKTVALDGNDLWVGGEGFIGIMDMQKQTLRKLCYTRTPIVDHIEIAGGYVWIMMNRSVYRIPLSETQ